MNIGAVFDLLLCLLILVVAVGAVGGRLLFTNVSLFVVFGLLLALGWVRLDAVDVALAEAAIGAGLTGVLLLGAVARLENTGSGPVRLSPIPALLCLTIAVGIGGAFLRVNDAGPRLEPMVRANLGEAGVDNPVTAVLLNFRSYDTLLEAVVLLIALVGVWSLTRDACWRQTPGIRQHARPDGILANFGRLLAPFGLIVGIYLVWAGSEAPGGAFQGGTVLAAAWLLAVMAGLAMPPTTADTRLRWVLVAGPLLFLLAGIYGMTQGAFLGWPPGMAATLILAIEFGLALSIAATLALLVLGAPRRVS
ncbi:MAG: MnhB domain-containing protein [Sphingomonadaceae bacterium]